MSYLERFWVVHSLWFGLFIRVWIFIIRVRWFSFVFILFSWWLRTFGFVGWGGLSWVHLISPILKVYLLGPWLNTILSLYSTIFYKLKVTPSPCLPSPCSRSQTGCSLRKGLWKCTFNTTGIPRPKCLSWQWKHSTIAVQDSNNKCCWLLSLRTAPKNQVSLRIWSCLILWMCCW